MFNNMFCCCCLLCKSSFYPGSSPTSSEQPPLSLPCWSSGSDCSCNAQQVGLIPGRGTKIPHVCGMAKLKKKKKSTNKKEKSKPNKKGKHKPNKKEKKKKGQNSPSKVSERVFPWLKSSASLLNKAKFSIFRLCFFFQSTPCSDKTSQAAPTPHHLVQPLGCTLLYDLSAGS